MALYMTQEGVLNNSFSVYNDAEELVYSIKGNIGMFTGTRSHLYDATGTKELAFIKQRFAQYKWDVIIDGQVVATVVKKWFSPKSKYRIEGINWQATGRLLFHEYTITDQAGAPVAELHKKAFRMTDSFEVALAEETPQQEILVLAVIVAIDAAIGQAGY